MKGRSSYLPLSRRTWQMRLVCMVEINDVVVVCWLLA